MEILTKRWYLLAIACVINLCTGSIYAWSVFAGPKAAQLSQLLGHVVTAGDLSLAFSLANGLAPIPMVLGGFINDRAGPRVRSYLAVFWLPLDYGGPEPPSLCLRFASLTVSFFVRVSA